MAITISEGEWRDFVISALRELQAETPEEECVHLSRIYVRVEEKIQEAFRLVNQNREEKIRQTLGEGCPLTDSATVPKQAPLAFRKPSGIAIRDGMYRLRHDGE